MSDVHTTDPWQTEAQRIAEMREQTQHAEPQERVRALRWDILRLIDKVIADTAAGAKHEYQAEIARLRQMQATICAEYDECRAERDEFKHRIIPESQRQHHAEIAEKDKELKQAAEIFSALTNWTEGLRVGWKDERDAAVARAEAAESRIIAQAEEIARLKARIPDIGTYRSIAITTLPKAQETP